MTGDQKETKKGPCFYRPYTYPECAEFLKRIARDYGEFGYFEIDRAIAMTVEEMLQKGILKTIPSYLGAKFRMISVN